MNPIELHFKKPGMNTLIQDSGRMGFQKFGVPLGGFMDRQSAIIANWLVGNPLDAALFEITMVGPEIHIDQPCQLAITGSDISPKINGKKAAMYETISLTENSTLTFGKLKSGCRAYLSFGGKIIVNDWLGSKSATSFETQLLTPQSLIKKGDTLSFEPREPIEPRKYRVFSEEELSTDIRIMPGPEYNLFPGDQLNFILKTKFTIGKDSNRMGYRLDERIPRYGNEEEIISSPIVPGTIQVTNSGQLIILMADAQTTGGYPRIANIITSDLGRVAQMKPGDLISFGLITLEDALYQQNNPLKDILS